MVAFANQKGRRIRNEIFQVHKMQIYLARVSVTLSSGEYIFHLLHRCADVIFGVQELIDFGLT